jgi:hypothetical protein
MKPHTFIETTRFIPSRKVESELFFRHNIKE